MPALRERPYPPALMVAQQSAVAYTAGSKARRRQLRLDSNKSEGDHVLQDCRTLPPRSWGLPWALRNHGSQQGPFGYARHAANTLPRDRCDVAAESTNRSTLFR